MAPSSNLSSICVADKGFYFLASGGVGVNINDNKKRGIL